MAIPETDQFSEFIAAIRLAPNEPVSETILATPIPSLPATDQDGRVSLDMPLWLHYPAGTALSFPSLVSRIRKELKALGHPSQDEFVLFMLAFSALARAESKVEALNEFLASACTADVNLYFVVWAELPKFYQYEIPPFRLGRVRADKLKWNSAKAGSDFYERYSAALPKAWGIERTPRRTTVLDVSAIRRRIFHSSLSLQPREPWELQAWEALVNGYFSQQNRILFDDFWSELIVAQDALLALGAPFFDPRNVTSVLQSMQIAIFLNFGGEAGGFVAPAGQAPLAIDLANAHKRVPQILWELKQSYGFEGFDGSPLHASMRLFASFIARARRHQISGHTEEALLHFVIALELVFGDRQAIQRSVSERVALVTHRSAGRSFDEQRKWIDKVYDLRSRYVHSGTLVKDESPIEDLYVTTQQCFRCFLRMHRRKADASARDEDALKNWLATVDYLAKGLMAGRSFSPDQFGEAFVD